MLTSLPTLPELGTALEQGASAGLAGAATALNPIGTAQTAATKAATQLGSGGTLFGYSVTKLTMIALGLILVAAGIFSFKETREVLVTAGKAAATAA